jgi:spore maturation protein CgeB
MRILYTETTAYYPSSAHFLEALERREANGEGEFRFLDEAKFIPAAASLAGRIANRIVGRPLQGYRELNRALVEQAAAFSPDLILIGKGSCFAASTLRAVKAATGATLVNWATDDPFNRADSSRDLLESIPVYDLYVCTKRAVVPDVIAAGCACASYVRFGYKPEVHFPEPAANEDEKSKFSCDVMFAGGCDEDRAPYFAALVRALPDVKLHLYGGYWDRVRELRSYARGFAVARDYRLAVAGAKIAANLVRRSNRDDHVMRTFEIPACGGFMLAERSATHSELFADGEEAAFFSSPEEFTAQVKSYLARDAAREQIAVAGRRAVMNGGHSYDHRLAEIIAAAQPLMRRREAALAASAR